LGLDIGSTAVKLVELSQTPSAGVQVENYTLDPLPLGAVVEKKIANLQAIYEAIRKAVTHSGTRVQACGHRRVRIGSHHQGHCHGGHPERHGDGGADPLESD